MKASTSKLHLWFFILILVQQAWGQNVEKTKNISEKYSVGTNDKLKIDSRFGKININTHNKNELSVNISIRAWGRNDEKAQEMLDKVRINYQKAANLISFETQISDNSLNINDKHGLEVNYEIQMPENLALEIFNKFGNVYISDFSGDLNLEVKYGQLKTQKLTGSNKQIRVSYGNCDIVELERGELHLTYGKAYISKTSILKLYNAYANVKFDQVGDLSTETKYGGIEIEEKLRSISGTMAYSNFKTESLSKSLVLETKYASGFKVENIAPDFEKIDVKASYGSVNLEFEGQPNFDFEIQAKYGNVNWDIKNVDFRRDISESFSKEYEGTVGKGGAAKVFVDVRYGNVKIEN